MKESDFIFLLPKQTGLAFLRDRRSRRELEKLCSRLNAVTRKNLIESGMRYLALYGFDGNSNLINVFGSPERGVMDLIFQFLIEKNQIRGAAVDVGANVGMHAIRFAKYYASVFAFEPHPVTFEMLKINLSHYAPAAQVFKVAASSTSGSGILYENVLQNLGAPSLTKTDAAMAEHVIELRRLDDIAELRGLPIGLIKVDTEEHELDSFKGAVELIRSNRPVLMFEDWKSRGGVASDVVEYLRTLGYSQFLVPEVLPGPHSNRLIRLFSVLRNGYTMGLRPCDFSAARGYELILALPGEPAKADGRASGSSHAH